MTSYFLKEKDCYSNFELFSNGNEYICLQYLADSISLANALIGNSSNHQGTRGKFLPEMPQTEW